VPELENNFLPISGHETRFEVISKSGAEDISAPVPVRISGKRSENKLYHYLYSHSLKTENSSKR
jgi:hypothetical protein